MIQNVKRLAQLLDQETLTGAERREGINLAQAMFGSTAHAHGDRVMVALRRKRSGVANDPSGAVARSKGTHTVIGVNTGGGTVASADDSVDLAPNEFKLGDDLYAANQDSAGRDYFTLNGKRIGRAKFEAAQQEASGEPVDEES